jgi:hypothetical protein
MPSARLFHLATHGILDDILRIGRAIALAPVCSDNGLLVTEEILDMNLYRVAFKGSRQQDLPEAGVAGGEKLLSLTATWY